MKHYQINIAFVVGLRPVSYMPNEASVSRLFIFDCPSMFSNVNLANSKKEDICFYIRS